MKYADITLEVDKASIAADSKIIFRDFSVALRTGERKIITGPSGCGKTSLLKAIMGFVPLSEGKITVQSLQLTAESVWKLRSSIGYIPQEPDMREESVLSFLKTPFSYKTNTGLTFQKEEAERLFERLKIDSTVLNRNCSSLSGGEKQRVILTLNILLKRNILLLDETGSALDRESLTAMNTLLSELHETSILAVSHHPEKLDFGAEIITMKGAPEATTASAGEDIL